MARPDPIPFANYDESGRAAVMAWAMQHDWAQAHGVEWTGDVLLVRFDQTDAAGTWQVVEEKAHNMRELRALAGY